YERLDVRVRLAGHVRLACAAEGRDLRVLELHAAQPLEVLRILRVRTREAALYPFDAEFVELPRDPDLVLNGKRNALHLRSVAEGRVVELNLGSCHGRTFLSAFEDKAAP